MNTPTSTPTVRIIRPSIDDFDDKVVVRGIIHPQSLSNIRSDFYQRELLPTRSRRALLAGIAMGERIPDVVLGMRGEKFDVLDDGSLVLADPVYVIDGQQRIRTFDQYIKDNCLERPKTRLGATIHLNTDANWERELFHKLNQFQVKVSPNLLLRNNKEDHVLLTTLYALTRVDKTSPLYNRVCWQQNMLKGELITALTLSMCILRLHSHLISGARTSGTVAHVTQASDKLVKAVGLPILRENIRAFMSLADECWGLRRIQLAGGAPYMRRAFLEVFTELLSDHPVFWHQPDERRLVVPYLLKKKISSIPFDDPEIHKLCASSGRARVTLYIQLVNFINSGKRIHRIKSRKSTILVNEADESEGDAD